MATKPRYWNIAYPLSVVSLCVAPRDYFQRHWYASVEASLGKLKVSVPLVPNISVTHLQSKDKPSRIPVLNGTLRLIWTYLFRCHEPGSTVTTKMEGLMKHFVPPNRSHGALSEERLELFGYIVHCILSRQLDYGSELCLELLQERNTKLSQSGASSAIMAPDRMTIAVQAILLSLHLLERDELTPSWPSSLDFSQIPSSDDYPSSSEQLDPSSLKSGWADLVEQSSVAIKALATTCYQAVGKMSILDEQYSSARMNLAYEEAHNYVIRQHPEGSIAYSIQYAPQITVLQLCFRSWPRCLHSSLPFEKVCEMLLRGVIHVEPGVNEAASATLERCAADFTHCSIMLSQFCTVLFDPQAISNDGTGFKLTVESSRVLAAWLSILTKWSQQIMSRSPSTLTDAELDTISSSIADIEAASLFMLSFTSRSIYGIGVKTVRILGKLRAHLEQEFAPPVSSFHQTSVVDALLGKAPKDYMHDQHNVLGPEDLNRLIEWRKSDKPDAALQMAESDDVTDRVLWKHIFPLLVQSSAEFRTQSLLDFREKLVAAANRYHPFIVQLSGINNKSAGAAPLRSLSIGDKDSAKLLSEHRSFVQQWHMWMKLICITAIVEPRPSPISSRDHARARSEMSVDRESMTTSRDLFKYLSLFLDSDLTVFREAAVSCISSLPSTGYSYLLEDLSLLSSRQLYDDPRTKGTPTFVGRIRRQERFQSAVASIYFLTALMLPQQRASGKQTALVHILKYIRTTQAFLSAPEHRDLFSLQRLRRYFCGALERFFDGLSTLNDVDRFIPAGMHISLYRLCEEWCQLGKQSDVVKKRLVLMQTAAARSYQDPTAQAELIQRFQTETRALSNAAVGAMSSLVVCFYSNSGTLRSRSCVAKGLLSSRNIRFRFPNRQAYSRVFETTGSFSDVRSIGGDSRFVYRICTELRKVRILPPSP
jgi:hypothetical protein